LPNEVSRIFMLIREPGAYKVFDLHSASKLFSRNQYGPREVSTIMNA
jgi:hypothetical protein